MLFHPPVTLRFWKQYHPGHFCYCTCISLGTNHWADPVKAFGNLLKRMLEASGRGMWNADSKILDKLKDMYSDLDDQMEGV